MDREVSFSSCGERISAILTQVPPPREVLWPAVVLCPDFAQTREIGLPAVAERLREAGYTCLRLDYRGWGASGGTPRAEVHPLQQVEDVRAAVGFLQQTDGVDPRWIVVWGAGLGGGVALCAAAVESRLCGAVAVSPVGDGGRWLRQAHGAAAWRLWQSRLHQDRMNRTRTGYSEYVPAIGAGEEALLPVGPEMLQWWTGSRAAPSAHQSHVTLASAEYLCAFRAERLLDGLQARRCCILASTEDTAVSAEESVACWRAAGPGASFRVCPPDLLTDHHAIWSGRGLDWIAQTTLDWLRRIPTSASGRMPRTDGTREWMRDCEAAAGLTEAVTDIRQAVSPACPRMPDSAPVVGVAPPLLDAATEVASGVGGGSAPAAVAQPAADIAAGPAATPPAVPVPTAGRAAAGPSDITPVPEIPHGTDGCAVIDQTPQETEGALPSELPAVAFLAKAAAALSCARSPAMCSGEAAAWSSVWTTGEQTPESAAGHAADGGVTTRRNSGEIAAETAGKRKTVEIIETIEKERPAGPAGIGAAEADGASTAAGSQATPGAEAAAEAAQPEDAVTVEPSRAGGAPPAEAVVGTETVASGETKETPSPVTAAGSAGAVAPAGAQSPALPLPVAEPAVQSTGEAGGESLGLAATREAAAAKGMPRNGGDPAGVVADTSRTPPSATARESEGTVSPAGTQSPALSAPQTDVQGGMQTPADNPTVGGLEDAGGVGIRQDGNDAVRVAGLPSEDVQSLAAAAPGWPECAPAAPAQAVAAPGGAAQHAADRAGSAAIAAEPEDAGVGDGGITWAPGEVAASMEQPAGSRTDGASGVPGDDLYLEGEEPPYGGLQP